MKKYIYFIAFILIPVLSYAQRPIELIPILNEPFPREVGDLSEDYVNYSLIVINHSDHDQDIYFHANFIGDNGVSISTDLLYRPTEAYTIPANQTVSLTAQDIQDLNNTMTEDDVQYEGITRNDLIFGSIPEGNYELCMSAYDFNSDFLLSYQCSNPVYISSGNVPEIILPFEGDSIPVTENPVFEITWEFPGNIAAQAMGYEYVLKMIDLTEFGDWDIEELFADPGVQVQLETTVDGMLHYTYNGTGDDPELIESHEYGIRIQAVDPFMQNEFENNGFSEIRRFWYGNPEGTGGGEEEEEEEELPADCVARCNPEVPENTTAVSSLSGIDEIRIGHFILRNPTLSASGGNQFSGTAEIKFKFISEININVDVTNIKINSDGKVFEGTVKARLAEESDIQGMASYLNLPDIPDPAYDVIPENIVTDLSNMFTVGRTINALATQDAVGLPLGFPLQVQGNGVNIGLTDIVITPEGAKSRVMLSMKLPKFNQEKELLLVGNDICLHPKGFGTESVFGIVSDIELTNGSEPNDISLFLNGEAGNPNAYCSVGLNCNGLEFITLAGHVLFPRNMLTPIPAEGVALTPEMKVRADFSFTLTQSAEDTSETPSNDDTYLNWMAGLTMDKFEVNGLTGWEFHVQDAYVDMSDLVNPPEIEFPTNYDNTDEDFRGFYLKSALLVPPPDIMVDSQFVLVENLIIEPALYATIQASNVLPIEYGSIDGFGFGIENLEIEIYDNSLVSGEMYGPIQIPICDVTDSLFYTAQINNPGPIEGDENDYEFVFNLSMVDSVSFPILVGNAVIAPSSYLEITWNPGDTAQTEVEVYLAGELGIETDRFYPESLPSLPAKLKMIGISYTIGLSSKTGINEDECTIAFASPQKGVGGFEANLNSFSLSSPGDFETIEATFDIGLAFGKGDIAIGAGADFTIISNIEILPKLEGGMGGMEDMGEEVLGIIKTFKITGIQFNRIDVLLESPALGIEGYIEFYNDPIINEEGDEAGYDKGAKGEITVKLPLAGIEGYFFAQFGKAGIRPDIPEGQQVEYSEDFFPYFFVRGHIIIGSGIPMGPIALYGVGGGVGYNMVQTAAAKIENGEVVGEPTFEPTWNSFRVELMVILGTAPSPKAFNCDVTIAAQFVSGGLDMLGIYGNGFIATDLPDRDDPVVQISVGIEYWTQTPTRNWNINGYLRIGMNINDKFRGNQQNPLIPNQLISADFYVSEETWFMKAGQPDMNVYDSDDPRGSAELVISENIRAEFKAYFMVGNDIPTDVPPLPLRIQEILNGPGETLPGQSDVSERSGIDEQAAANGSGVAFGSSGSLDIQVSAAILKVNLWVMIGFDLNITRSDRDIYCENSDGLIGLNGWYGSGQAYAGIEGTLDLAFKLFGKERAFNIMTVAAAIALRGGAPNPAYFSGQASVYYSVLGGSITGNSSFDFAVGEECQIVGGDPFANVKFIESVSPSHNERSIPPYRGATIKYSLPMEAGIVVPVVLEDKNGEVIGQENRTYTPYATSVLYEGRGNGLDEVQTSKHWTDVNYKNGQSLIPQGLLDEFEWHTLKVTIKAWDHHNKEWLKIDNKLWTQDTLIEYKTGDWPEDLYDLVQYSTPLPFERYFLQDETLGDDIILFGYDLTSQMDRNFPGWDNRHDPIAMYEYYIRLTELSTQEVTTIEFDIKQKNSIHSIQQPNGIGRPVVHTAITYRMPELENDKIYALQVIRKTNFNLIENPENENNELVLYEGNGERLLLNSEPLPPGSTVLNNEFLLYHTYFQTSKYNTVREKMSTLDIKDVSIRGDSHTYGGYIKLLGDLGESFEVRDVSDFHPHTPNNPELQSLNYLKKVVTTDKVSSDFHDDAEDIMKEFITAYNLAVTFSYCYPIIQSDYLFDWADRGIVKFHITGDNFGNVKEPLTESMIGNMWSNYINNGTLTYNPSNINGFNGMQVFNIGMWYDMESGTAYNFSLKIRTHRKLEKDRQDMEDWLNFISTKYCLMISYNNFLNSISGLRQKVNRVKNADFKASSSKREQGLLMVRNISLWSEGEQASFFKIHQFDYELPIEIIRLTGSGTPVQTGGGNITPISGSTPPSSTTPPSGSSPPVLNPPSGGSPPVYLPPSGLPQMTIIL